MQLSLVNAPRPGTSYILWSPLQFRVHISSLMLKSLRTSLKNNCLALPEPGVGAGPSVTSGQTSMIPLALFPMSEDLVPCEQCCQVLLTVQDVACPLDLSCNVFSMSWWLNMKKYLLRLLLLCHLFLAESSFTMANLSCPLGRGDIH